MYKEEYPKNHGKLWTVGDMWKLVTLYHEKVTWNTIARKLHRTESACQARFYIIRLAFILMEGSDAKTIMDAVSFNPDTMQKGNICTTIQYCFISKSTNTPAHWLPKFESIEAAHNFFSALPKADQKKYTMALCEENVRKLRTNEEKV